MMDHLKRVHNAGQNGTEVREMSEGMKRCMQMIKIEINSWIVNQKIDIQKIEIQKIDIQKIDVQELDEQKIDIQIIDIHVIIIFE